MFTLCNHPVCAGMVNYKYTFIIYYILLNIKIKWSVKCCWNQLWVSHQFLVIFLKRQLPMQCADSKAAHKFWNRAIISSILHRHTLFYVFCSNEACCTLPDISVSLKRVSFRGHYVWVGLSAVHKIWLHQSSSSSELVEPISFFLRFTLHYSQYEDIIWTLEDITGSVGRA